MFPTSPRWDPFSYEQVALLDSSECVLPEIAPLRLCLELQISSINYTRYNLQTRVAAFLEESSLVVFFTILYSPFKRVILD